MALRLTGSVDTIGGYTASGEFIGTASYAITASHVVGGGGGGGNVQTPVITGTLTSTVEQFTSFEASDYAIQGGATGMWAVINNGEMTASLGTTTTISNTNSITTNILNNTGSFTSDIYAQTALGRSDAATLTITVDEYNVSSSNVFGSTLANYYLQIETNVGSNPDPGTTAQYVYWGNGVINDDQGVVDVENTTGITGIDTRDYAIWYNASAGKLLAAEYTQAGALNQIQTCIVSDFTNTTTNQSGSSFQTVTTNEKLQGKLFGKYQTVSGFYHIGAPSSNFYLEISGSGGLFNSFGTNNQGDWMYGFNLLDDWIQSPGGPNMLMPTGSGKPFIFAPTSYYITTSDNDYVIYGDDSTVLATTSGISWVPDSNGVMAPSGSSIIVWFDDSANTTYLYVDGVQKVSSTSVDNYMGASATTDPVIQFGNIEPFIPNIDYSDQEWLQNFPWRINNLWVANAGTSLSSADVTELASHANISDSTNYSSIEFHSQEINETPDKGAAVLSRKSFTRPVTPA